MSLEIVCRNEDTVITPNPIHKLSRTDRLLPLWIILSMGFGLLIGNYVPNISNDLNVVNISGVPLIIAIGLWLMMLPVLTKVRYELLPTILTQRTICSQIGISCCLNWVVGPFLMTALAWLFLPDLERLRNGTILVGLARCIAMVLIWNDLALGDVELCAMLVAINSILQVFLYTPYTLFFINVISHTSIHVGFWLVAKSVLLYLGVPLVGGVILRYSIISIKSTEWLNDQFIPYFSPVALYSLLYTIVIMFANQGEKIIHNFPKVIRVSVPLVFYFAIMFFASLFISWRRKHKYSDAVTQAFTASGNNFELAIAIAIATFGIESDEALAATIGPLIEVPVLVSLVYFSLWSRKFYSS